MVEEVVRQTKKHVKGLTIQDVISITTITTILPVGYLIQMTYIMSFWFDLFSDSWLLRAIPITAFAFNAYLNILHVFLVGPNGQKSALPTVVKPGYRFCHSCQLNSPPRAYHCPVCDTCILRRDHHCSFASVCVGHFNQRYFFAATVNILIVFFACTYYNVHLCFDRIPQFSSFGQIWQVMIPHIALFLGYISVSHFCLIFFTVASITCLLFVIYLVAAQLFCIYRGQTRVEYLLDIHAYNLGFWENMNQSLGSHWILALISPFLPSPLPSDGISFKHFDAPDVAERTKYL